MKAGIINRAVNYSYSKLALWAIGLTFLAMALSFSNWNKGQNIQSDVIIYYQYLTAAFQFNDLTFDFAYHLPEDFDGEIWVTKTDTGIETKMTMGVAVMMTPFYLMAAGINELFDLGSYGYSPLFQFFIFLGALTYAILGLIILRKLLLSCFSESVTALALVVVGMGTNLTYFVSLNPGMSHVYSFFLFACVLVLSKQWYDTTTIRNSVLLGLCLGLVILVRFSNGILLLLPFLYGITSDTKVSERVRWYLKTFRYFLIIGLTAGLIVSLQFMFWKYSSGSWFVYGYGDEGFFWAEPKFMEGLFSPRKGWLLYSPLMILSLAGLFFRFKGLKEMRFTITAFLLLNLYVVFSWWCWWYGGGFGMRPLIESYALLIIPLAVAIKAIMSKNAIKIAFIPILAALIFLNIFQTVQYRKGIIHYDGMTWKAYKSVFLKKHNPSDYFEYIKSPNYEEAKKGNR